MMVIMSIIAVMLSSLISPARSRALRRSRRKRVRSLAASRTNGDARPVGVGMGLAEERERNIGKELVVRSAVVANAAELTAGIHGLDQHLVRNVTVSRQDHAGVLRVPRLDALQVCGESRVIIGAAGRERHRRRL